MADQAAPPRATLSISLFGPDHGTWVRYASHLLAGMTAFAKHPGSEHWDVRLYHDDHITPAFRVKMQALTNGRTQFVPMGRSHGLDGMFWRFLVHDDDSVDVYFVHDAEEGFTPDALAEMDAWRQAGSNRPPFVTIKPRWYHTARNRSTRVKVPGGYFGVDRRQAPRFRVQPLIEQKTLSSTRSIPRERTGYGADELWLEDVFLPAMGGVVSYTLKWNPVLNRGNGARRAHPDFEDMVCAPIASI